MEQLARSIHMLGPDKIESLATKKVAVFGLGGVGGYVVEALVRMGVGHLVLIDHDVIDITNLNRQLYALHSTIGKDKVAVAYERCKDINPDVEIECYKEFFLPDDTQDYLIEGCDFVVDAIDSTRAKIALIEMCYTNKVRIISCMGTGNRLDPTKLEICKIEKTINCPLAKIIRKELKDKRIKKVPVLASTEVPIKVQDRKPGSVSFVPSAAGTMIAGYVLRELMEEI